MDAEPVIDREITWNNPGKVFRAIWIKIRNTASAAASKILDFEVDGTSVFSVAKDGGASAAATVRSAASVAPPAAGAVTCGITASSTANLGLFFGTGAPTFAAAKGSLYVRTDATTTTTRLYINTNGATTWTTFTTAA